jgi:hypothetical protein
MNAWNEKSGETSDKPEESKDLTFEDNFEVSNPESNSNSHRLEDSEQYLARLGEFECPGQDNFFVFFVTRLIVRLSLLFGSIFVIAEIFSFLSLWKKTCCFVKFSIAKFSTDR